MLGPAHPDPSRIPRLTVVVQDQANAHPVRDSAAHDIVEIAKKYPEYRHQCIAILTATLERYLRNPIELNTSLISHLLNLKAKESASMIQQVIQAGEYDRKSIGDWNDVSRSLGVFQSPPSSAPPPPPASMLPGAAVDPAAAFLSVDPARAAATISSGPHLTDKQREKLRAKRKKERKAKRQNRRR
jgi:hypothetical protein